MTYTHNAPAMNLYVAENCKYYYLAVQHQTAWAWWGGGVDANHVVRNLKVVHQLLVEGGWVFVHILLLIVM